MTSVAIATKAERFDAATKFLAALAYPDSHRMRDRACLAMRALFFRYVRRVTWRLPREAYRQAMNEMKVEPMRGVIRRLEDRLEKRIRATELCSYILLRWHLDRLQRARASEPIREISLNELQEKYQIGPHYRDTWNMRVMHLGMGLRHIWAHWSDAQPFGVFTLLINPDWVTAAIAFAEKQFEELRDSPWPLPSALERIRFVNAVRIVARKKSRSPRKNVPSAHDRR